MLSIQFCVQIVKTLSATLDMELVIVRTKEQLNLTLVPNRVVYYHLSKKKVSKEVDVKYVRAM
ncbi:hypothetical protein PFNF54_01987 [Plasmodium falciparum NF54]|uniref:Uncharacterized protein n=1 Tax=Plasmodium falciparum (isolate NF54) TaxID=5843 RepID=W7JVZ0_PLAFO|nr:hypothetical protein PFNF54_01987 [Plasmodium falciparum NF54]